MEYSLLDFGPVAISDSSKENLGLNNNNNNNNKKKRAWKIKKVLI